MRRNSLFALVAIILLAAELRFYQVGSIPLRADEATNLYLALESPEAIIRLLVTSDPHLPLYYLLLHFWLPLSGNSELALRYPTIFAAVLVVPLVYALGRHVFSRHPSIAVLGALLAAINPYLIWDAQDAYMYSLLTAAGLGSFLVFVEAIRSGASLKTWIKYIVISALALYLHYFAGLIMIAQGAVWLLWSATRAITRRTSMAWLGAQIVIAAIYAPWLVLALPLLIGFKLNFFPAASAVELLIRAFVAFSVGRMDSRLMTPMVEPVVGSVLASVFAIIFLLGLFVSFKASVDSENDTNGRGVLGIFVLVPLGVYFLFTLLRFPVFDERYTLFLIPVFLLVVARGLVILHKRISHVWVSALALTFVFLASAHSLFNYWVVPSFAKSPDWHAFVSQLFAESRSGDVLIQNYPDPALPYYLQDRIPRVLLPRVSPSNVGDVAMDMERLTAKYERVWVQPVPFGEWDTDGLVAVWLDRYARLVSTYEFRGLQLALYLPARTALRQAQPSDALFDGRISLLAYDLDDSARFRPGQTAHLILYWQAQARTPHDLTVFVHLYDADGKLWSQQDNPPIHGTYPTSEWSAGEIIVDRYDVGIPANVPAGTYLLAVGMYDSQTQERVKAVNGRGQSFPQDYVPLQKEGW